MQCKFIKPNNSQCGAKALKCKDYCFFHSQDRVVKKQRFIASSEGGKNNSKCETCVSEDMYFQLKSISEVLNLLEFTTNKLLLGEINRSKASCIGYLANITIGAIKDSTFEQRLGVIENVLQLSKQTPKRI